MPLSIQIPYRGDQYLFQGISNAGQGIGAGIEAMTQRLRQTKAMRTMAIDGMGMDPDKVDNMSPEQIQGMMQGIAVRNAQAQAQAQREMELAHANYFNRFNQKMDADQNFSNTVAQYMNGGPTTLTNGDQGPAAPPTLDPQTLMRLEAQSGTLDPEKAMQYMKQLGGGAAADNPLVFDTTSIPNATVVKTKHGNEFQVLRNNDGAAPDAPPGYQMVGDGKGGWKPVKLNTGDLSQGDRAKYIAQYEKNIDGLISSYAFAKGDPEMETLIKGRIKAHSDAIDELKNGAGGASKTPAAAAPANAPAKKAMGGYKIGVKYGKLIYQGGDPNDQNNWQQSP